MKLLFATRLKRAETTVAIKRLTFKVSFKISPHDRALKRPIQYEPTYPDIRIHSTLCTEQFADAQVRMSSNADQTSDLETNVLGIRSRNGAARLRFISKRFKKQESTAVVEHEK